MQRGNDRQRGKFLSLVLPFKMKSSVCSLTISTFLSFIEISMNYKRRSIFVVLLSPSSVSF